MRFGLSYLHSGSRMDFPYQFLAPSRTRRHILPGGLGPEAHSHSRGALRGVPMQSCDPEERGLRRLYGHQSNIPGMATVMDVVVRVQA